MTGRPLAGRVALVTGAARNIGRAIAIRLAQDGASIIVAARSDKAAADAVVEEITAASGSALSVLADVTRPDEVEAMIAAGLDRYGRLDILVNNAAVRKEAAFADLTYAEWREIMAIALDGPFLCCRAALTALAASDAGSIINIGGLTAYTGAARRAHVVAAKAGLDGLTRALAHDLAPNGVTVNLVSPGLIDTVREVVPHHHQERTTLLGRRGAPDDVSGMVAFLAGPEARYITGQSFHVNGGVYLG